MKRTDTAWRICDHAHTGWIVADGERTGATCEACARVVLAANPGRTFEPGDVDAPVQAPVPVSPGLRACPAPAVALAPVPADPYLVGMGGWVAQQRAQGARIPERRAS